jgi:hypothetical protein
MSHNPESCERKYSVVCLSCGEKIPDISEAGELVVKVDQLERLRAALLYTIQELGIDIDDADGANGKWALEVFEKRLKDAT